MRADKSGDDPSHCRLILAGERAFSEYLKEEWRCRDCNRRWGE